MSKSISNAENITQVFVEYCKKKNYQVKYSTDADNDFRLDISNLQEKTLVIVYHTDSIVVGGKKNSLNEEFNNLKKEIETNPQNFLIKKTTNIKSCTVKYVIIVPEIRQKLKEGLNTPETTLEIIDNPKPDIEYRAKIIKNGNKLTVTQFDNSTLLLQGKEDTLLNETCDFIEKAANPAEEDVIVRFISSDEKNLEYFTAKYTPKLLELAKKNVIEKLGDVYSYLESYDQKWFVASECLCLTKIPLPEFSPLVMPASKAFEGFAKKLLIGIGLFEADYFMTTNANFSALYDKNNQKRKSICNKEKHADTILEKIGICVKTNRHFMMHSDESKITKVDTQEEAEEKVNIIFKDTKEIFNYFNDLYSLLPK